MADTCKMHGEHSHQHGPSCGHTSVQHEGHTDYVHDGHLHHPHEGHVDECAIGINAKNPASATPSHDCGGHEAIPHGDHTDYLVNDHLHHHEGGRCHDHGPLHASRAA